MSLSEIDKAAILLIALGPERAQNILNQLDAPMLLPLIDAMKRMRHVSGATRRAVLKEVADLLDGLAAGKKPSDAGKMDLLNALGPYLPEKIDPDRIDWNRAGFDFDASDGESNPPPGGRR